MESVLSDTSYQNYDVYGDNLRIEAVSHPQLSFIILCRPSTSRLIRQVSSTDPFKCL